MTARPYETIAEAAARLGYSPGHLANLAQAGRLPGAVRYGRQWLLVAGCQMPERERPGRKPKGPGQASGLPDS